MQSVFHKKVLCLLLLQQASVVWAALKVMTAVFTISSPTTSCAQQVLLLHAKVVHATRGVRGALFSYSFVGCLPVLQFETGSK